ncbi:hypothetical protein PLICRDRAFT_98006 [Plicaturopsis crispa FD-325 SS-3]|nr:hypothetical protein PLICRDRAFT_98006 [Plicaturopsis crispa FD-325 SS-3]
MPSKTLAHAYKGDARPTQLSGAYARNGMQDYADVRFNESHGAALAPVHEALYGRRARRAKDRMHWAFPPDQDERVEMLLSWIQAVAHGLAAFGLHKFLQSRERGALFANADYVSPEDPAQPAFDWLTFDQLQPTRDRILQESVSTYDPATTVVVFVFLPSASGRSMAVWRRKLAVPNNIRLAYIAEITQTMKTLKKDYVCMVDELPNDHRRMSKPPASPPAPKKKKKWWKLNIRW